MLAAQCHSQVTHCLVTYSSKYILDDKMAAWLFPVLLVVVVVVVVLVVRVLVVRVRKQCGGGGSLRPGAWAVVTGASDGIGAASERHLS